MNYVIKNEYYTATVNGVGAELISVVTADGREVMWQSPSEDFWSKHAPLLFPICGQLKDKKYTYRGKSYDMKGHGFIGGENFELVESGEDYVVLRSVASEDTLKKYPFDYSFVARYALEGKRVVCTVTIENNGEDTMPYMFGWHPGFALPEDGGAQIEDYVLDFGDTEPFKVIPLQNGPFASPVRNDFPLVGGKYTLCEEQIYENDTLILENTPTRVTLSSKKSPFKLDLEWTGNTPYLCVWKWPSSEAKYICLEPWTGTPADGESEENFETRKMQRLGSKMSETYNLSFEMSI
jgi:galactose mutarotase-like enzyme